MKVVILCGGLGTRLREETEYRPKPMVPIGGRPILWHIMKTYASHGHKDFILCLGYKGDVIKDYFRNYKWNVSDVTLKLSKDAAVEFHNDHEEEDWTVTLLETGATTERGVRLKRALDFVTDENFLFTYGDGLTDSDINASIRFHEKSNAVATVTAVRPPGRFGDLLVEHETVVGFNEKPEQQRSLINGGFMVLNRKIREHFPAEDMPFESGVLSKLTEDRLLAAYVHDGFWQCMDTYREQNLLEQMWKSGSAPWKVW